MTIEYKDSKRIVGLSNDIVDTATYTDDFNATQWVSTDISKLNVSSGALDFQKSGSEKISYDLGASSVSDSAFVLRAKMNITTTQGDATFIGVVMSADTNSGNTAGEWLGLSMSTDQNVFSAQSAESGVLSQGSSGSDDILALANGTYYVEITRLSDISYKVELFDEPTFAAADSVGFQTKPISSSLGSFRYIKVMNRHGSGGNIVGTLDDIEFWNGVTTASGTATHSDNFSTYWEQNTTGTTNIAVANSRVEYDVTDSGTLQSTLVYDLGTANISETSWTLRGKSVIDNYASGNANSCHFFCGLSNGDKTVAFDGSQNSISFAIGVGTNDAKYYLGSSVNGTMYSMTNQTSGDITHIPTAETVWFEIKRNNATSATITLYTDSTYTTSPAGYSRTLTLSSAPTGLRYLVFKSRDRSISSQSLDGYVDDLEFYNGTTSSKPTDVPDNSILIEKDTGKRYWFDDAFNLSGLKAYWKFNDPSGDITNQATSIGSTDSLDTDADLQVTGASYNNANTPFNTMDFDGNNDVAKAGTSTSQFNFMHDGGKFTVCMWVSLNSITDEGYLISDITGTNTNGFGFTQTSSSRWLFRVFDSGIWLDQYMGSTHGMTAGTFYFLTFTWDPTESTNKATFYRDGVEIHTANQDRAQGSSSNANSVVGVGAQGSNTGWLGCEIAEMSVWNRVLTDTEITTIYNSGNGKTLDTAKGATWTKDKQVTSGSAMNAGGGAGSATTNAQTSSNYVWTNITAISTARQYSFGSGNANNFTIGSAQNVENSQTWNGTAWATAITINTQRRDTTATAGSYNDMIVVYGRNNAGTLLNTSAKFDGTTWSAGTTANTAREHPCGAGQSDSMLVAGGYDGSPATVALVDSYNGTAWTTETVMPTASYGQNMGASASDSAHTAGGSSAMSGTYDGTTWTNTTELSVPTTTYGAGGGDRDEHLFMSGYSGGTNYDTTYLWNGTTWVAKDDLTVGKRGVAGDCTAR